MALKEDLKKSFEDNLNNSGEIKDIAKLITDSYKKAVSSNSDSLLNSWTGINYETLQKQIESQFKLSFDTKSYLNFDLIEAGLISSWSSAILVVPAIPAPGMSLVTSGVVVSSTAPKTPPLSEPSDNYDTIVNSFFNMFVNHALSLSFTYIGTSVSNAPISIPIVSFTIK